MKNTSLCYLKQDGKLLMLYRNKKKHDPNAGKWIGVGGKLEEKESPPDCAKREVLEETGLTMNRFDYRGLVTFVSDEYETEQMHLFTCEDFSGELKECDEGTLRWIDENEIDTLPLWEGDRIFLRLIRTPRPFFSLKLVYEGDRPVRAVLDGAEL